MPHDANPDDIDAAKADLDAAYQFFNWATDPRAVTEAIHRIRAAQIRLDALTHPGDPETGHQLPWLGSGHTPGSDAT